MKIEKMRCHPTIILEKAWGFLAAWIVIIFSQAENIISFFMEESIVDDDIISLAAGRKTIKGQQ